MTTHHSERLSALDASFLGFEEPNARWHEGAVMVFDNKNLHGVLQSDQSADHALT